MMTETVKMILAILTFFGQLGLIAFLIGFNFKPFKRWKRLIILKSRAINFIVSATAMLGSLYFSEIAGWEPCRLCWYQRIFMYPIPIILGTSLIIKDKKNINRYVAVLSFFGILFAGYHYISQKVLMYFSTGICSTDRVSCFVEYFRMFGYINIPMMALTGFLIIFVLSLIDIKINSGIENTGKKKGKKNKN